MVSDAAELSAVPASAALVELGAADVVSASQQLQELACRDPSLIRGVGGEVAGAGWRARMCPRPTEPDLVFTQDPHVVQHVLNVLVGVLHEVQEHVEPVAQPRVLQEKLM